MSLTREKRFCHRDDTRRITRPDHVKGVDGLKRSLLLVLAMLVALLWSVGGYGQNSNASNRDIETTWTPIHDGSGSTLLSWNGTTPESPNGEQIAYFRMPNVEANKVHDYVGEQWVCDADLTDNRKVFEMKMRTEGFEHNGSMASWIDNQRLAFRGTGGDHGTIYLINVDTGELLHEIAAHPGSIAHKPARKKLAFGVARPENVKANQQEYSTIDEPALYVLDLKTDEVSKIVSLETINDFLRSQGYPPKNGATFVHVIPSPDANRIMTRWVPKDSGRGLLLSHDMQGNDMVVYPNRPLHQLWYDNDSYIAVDRAGQQIKANRIGRFQQDGTLIEILAGPGNHIDISADRQWLVTDSQYHRTPVNISLYRRGDLKPTAQIARHHYGEAVWQKGAHANPVFSRNGQWVYFTHAVSNTRVQAVRVNIHPIVE